AEHATQKIPVIENFLYLFFSPSEASQAAGRAFWKRRHTRVDQDVASSATAMRAQAAAIAQWGVVPGTDRYSQLKKIIQPVLIVNGSNDIMVLSINSFILQQHIPNAMLMARSFSTLSYLSPTCVSFSKKRNDNASRLSPEAKDRYD